MSETGGHLNRKGSNTIKNIIRVRIALSPYMIRRWRHSAYVSSASSLYIRVSGSSFAEPVMNNYDNHRESAIFEVIRVVKGRELTLTACQAKLSRDSIELS
jgi:hypothetical protein